MKTIILILILFLCSTIQASEKIYKWVDANGQAHYTNKKPDDINSEEINISTPATQAPQASQFNQSINKEDINKRKEEYRERRETNNKKNIANRKKCKKAKATLARFQQQARFSHTTADGEQHYLEDSQREKILKASNKAIKKHCK